MRTKLLIVLVILAAAGVYFREPLRLLALYAAGRTQGCPLAESLESARTTRRTAAAKDRILANSKLLEKDPAGFHLWQTPRGRYWITKGSDWDLPWNLAEMDRDIYGLHGLGVRARDVVLDCGANVGVFVRQSLDRGARQVVAIEIAPDNLECLRRNFVEEIKAGRVTVYPKGVWNKDDVLTLTQSANEAADSVVMKPEGAKQGPQVPLTTIDKLAAELKLDRVDFIKMDIEGAETKALEGGRETISKYHPRLAISAYHLPADPVEIPRRVRAAWPGYRTVCGLCEDAGSFIRPDVLYFH